MKRTKPALAALLIGGCLLASAMSVDADTTVPFGTANAELDADLPASFDLRSEQGRSMVADFAKSHGLAVGEAQRVFEDSSSIAEFLEAHRDDERFGELWATYDRGYEIHVRYLADDFDLEIAALEQRIGRAVTIHRGGSSSTELSAAVDYLTTNGIPYEPDITKGVLRVFSETFPTAKGAKASDLDRMGAITVEQGAPPKYQTVDHSRSGADVWWSNNGSWSLQCTAAAMWKGTGQWSGMTGYLWAAHCPNLVPSYTYVDGGYSHGSFATMHTVCGPGGDWELIRFSVPKNEHETFLDKRFNPAVETPFRIAGGYYVGQPSFKVGLSTNGSTGTNMGSVAAYATSEVGVACEAVRPHLRYWHQGTGGDSGGPVFLFYNNEWYLGAVHNGYESSFGGFQYGSAIWDISVPQGHLCSLTSPCT